MSITARGGYQIIDGMGFLFSEDNPFYRIPGIYNKALNQLNKPCYFGNIRIRNKGTIVNVPFQAVTFTIDDSGLFCNIVTENREVSATIYINNKDELGLD